MDGRANGGAANRLTLVRVDALAHCVPELAVLAEAALDTYLEGRGASH